MASAVLANGNDSVWVQYASRFMGKVPNPNPSSYSHSNPPKKQKQSHHKVNGGGQKVLDDLPEVRPTASDDAYSFVQKPIERNRNMEFNDGGFVTYDVAAYSKSELADLRMRMVSELEQIRNLRDRIELGKVSGTPRSPNPQGKLKKSAGNKRSVPISSDPNLSNGFVDCVMDEGLIKECKQILSKLMKHKYGWVFNTPVDTAKLGLHDYNQIIKQPMDLGTVRSNLSKNVYLSPLDFASDVRLTFDNAILYNPKEHEVHQWAAMLLSRFDDLFKPIQEKLPVDRRKQLNKCGFDGVAEELQGSSWNHVKPSQEKLPVDRRKPLNGGGFGGVVEELQGSSWNHVKTPEKERKPKLSPRARKQERMQSQPSAPTMSNPPPSDIPTKAQSPVLTLSPKVVQPSKPRVPKQPKPKAKDPNKRDMTMEEKHKLGFELQGLPQEKLPQLVHIIGKRNEHLAQDGDEIELDIEALDTETLWELDRFVTYWKKMVSKSKRQALLNNNNPVTDTSTAELDDRGASSGREDPVEELKKDAVGDEGVDIDDDIPTSSFPAVEIEKNEVVGLNRDYSNEVRQDLGSADEVGGQDLGSADEVGGQDLGNADVVVRQEHGNGNSSGSSSSSSDSSSSSGSGSSSGSDDSDADDAQS